MRKNLRLFDYIRNESSQNCPYLDSVKNILREIKRNSEKNTNQILNSVTRGFSKKDRKEVRDLIEGLDHIAFVVMPDIDVECLDNIASLTGFPNEHKILPSELVEKELGNMIGQDRVITNIFKAWGQNNKMEKIGIELFIPQIQKEIAFNWIKRGVSNHVAFKVKNEEAIFKIQNIFYKYNLKMPFFMHNYPMKNTKENRTVCYFDLPQNPYPRVEFFYQESA